MRTLRFLEVGTVQKRFLVSRLGASFLSWAFAYNRKHKVKMKGLSEREGLE
jgi:hypothetical protein